MTKIVQKRVKTTLRAKWSFHAKNGRSHFLNLWWILSMKDQTLKFLWFQDSFEGIWNENMQGHFRDHFGRISFFELQKYVKFFGEGYFLENCSLFLDL